MAQFCASLADAVCQGEVECGRLGREQRTACTAMIASQCSGSILAPVRAGRRAYDPTEAAACVEGVQRASCWGYFPDPRLPQCPNVTAPAQPLGAPCGDPFPTRDCAEGYCPYLNGACGSVCTPYVDAGGACDVGDSLNRYPETSARQCDPSSGRCLGSVCTRIPGRNEGPCEPGLCQRGLSCDTSIPDGGLCLGLRADGELCVSAEQCTTNRCNDRSEADGGRRCGTSIGALCEAPADCLPGSSYCTASAGGAGTCERAGLPGESCEFTTPPSTLFSTCAGLSECVDQRCVASECLSDQNCPRGTSCTEAPGGGHLCSPDPQECQPCAANTGCALGLACTPDRHCRRLPAEHERCDELPCTAMLSCLPSADGGSTCEASPLPALSPVGAPCLGPESCESNRCLEEDGGAHFPFICFHGPCSQPPLGTCAPGCP